jgi:hypothetical protein
MAVELPWFFAVDHVPASGTASGFNRAMIIGPSALTDAGSVSGVASVASLLSGRIGLKVPPRTSSFARIDVPPVVELTVGFRIGSDFAINTTPAIIDLQTSAGTSLLALYHNHSTGKLEVRRGATVLATGTATLTDLLTYYVEFYALIDDTAGAFEVRVNGIEDMAGAGVNTANTSGSCERVVLISIGNNSTNAANVAIATDIYIREASGPSFYGPILLRPLRPTSDVQAEWTPDTGTDNYARVNETTSDQDTSYIESDTMGDRDIYELGDLPGGENSIIAVVGVTVAQAASGGAPLVATGISDGTNTVIGGGRAIGPQGTYQTQTTVFATAPGGGPWSPGEVNALRLAVEAA